MPLKTQVSEEIIRAGLIACRKRLAATSRKLLAQKLTEIDHQAADLARYRAHLVELLATIPHEHSEDNI